MRRFAPSCLCLSLVSGALALCTFAAVMGCGGPRLALTPKGEISRLTADPVFGAYEFSTMSLASRDGTELAVNVYTPSPSAFQGPRPAVIFVNSWNLTQWEYDLQARNLASDGYVVLSYQTRGFGDSGGEVTVGGQKDLEDISTLIDWIYGHTFVDRNRLAMCGISYGAGISLLAAASDARIKTVVAISGWADFERSLFGNETVHEMWIDLLTTTGELSGHLSREMTDNVEKLRGHRDIEAVRAWAGKRSPIRRVAQFNERKVPVFLGNSYQDNLFAPVTVTPFFQALSGPKMLFLDEGVHASSSLPALVGMPAPIWEQARRWLDFWLMGIPNGINREPPVSFATAGGREYFDDVPVAVTADELLRLKPLNVVERAGGGEVGRIHIFGGKDSEATSGVPLLADLADVYLRRPVEVKFTDIDRQRAVVYVTDPLPHGLRLRGSPHLNFALGAHTGPMQVVAYLYDLSPDDVGTLLGHAVMSRYSAHGSSTIDLDLGVLAKEVSPGQRLGVVLDTQDPLYANPSPGPYELEVLQGVNGRGPWAEVKLPLVP